MGKTSPDCSPDVRKGRMKYEYDISNEVRYLEKQKQVSAPH